MIMRKYIYNFLCQKFGLGDFSKQGRIKQRSFLGSVIILGIFGIALTIVNHYANDGFNLSLFLCIDVPLYLFVGYVTIKMYPSIERFLDENP